MTLQEAIRSGRKTWATVLRGQSVRMVPGEAVRDGELLSWCFEGGAGWVTVGNVRLEFVRNPRNKASN